jgi:hypothetical protein
MYQIKFEKLNSIRSPLTRRRHTGGYEIVLCKGEHGRVRLGALNTATGILILDM